MSCWPVANWSRPGSSASFVQVSLTGMLNDQDVSNWPSYFIGFNKHLFWQFFVKDTDWIRLEWTIQREEEFNAPNPLSHTMPRNYSLIHKSSLPEKRDRENHSEFRKCKNKRCQEGLENSSWASALRLPRQDLGSQQSWAAQPPAAASPCGYPAQRASRAGISVRTMISRSLPGEHHHLRII